VKTTEGNIIKTTVLLFSTHADFPTTTLFLKKNYTEPVVISIRNAFKLTATNCGLVYHFNYAIGSLQCNSSFQTKKQHTVGFFIFVKL
jgi:hypothetical protein